MFLLNTAVVCDYLQDALDPALLSQLLGELGTLASVYHKPAGAFVSRARLAVQRAEDLAAGAAARAEEEGGGCGLASHGLIFFFPTCPTATSKETL